MSWYFFCGSFMGFFLSCVCYAFGRVCLYVHCGHLLGKGWPLGSRLWCLTVSLSLFHWYPGSGVVLDCIDSWSLHTYLLWHENGHKPDKFIFGCRYFLFVQLTNRSLSTLNQLIGVEWHMDTNQIISFYRWQFFLLVLFKNRSLSTVKRLLRFDVKWTQNR